MKEMQLQLIQSFSAAENWFEKAESKNVAHRRENEWNILQILEHIVLCNKYLLEMLEEEVKTNKADENIFVGVRGPLNWPNPSRMQPNGKMDKDELRECFSKQFASSLQLLKRIEDVEGKSRVAQGLLFLSLHINRHVRQMEKLKTDLALN